MADQQFDVSEKMQKLFAIKKKQREESKAFFMKALENPHRPMLEPPPFDPVFFRYSSIQAYAYEHFRVNPFNLAILAFGFFLPVGALTYYIHNTHFKRESILRGGEIAYKDRAFKNVL